jgi:hypothetical protein
MVDQDLLELEPLDIARVIAGQGGAGQDGDLDRRRRLDQPAPGEGWVTTSWPSQSSSRS